MQTPEMELLSLTQVALIPQSKSKEQVLPVE